MEIVEVEVIQDHDLDNICQSQVIGDGSSFLNIYWKNILLYIN